MYVEAGSSICSSSSTAFHLLDGFPYICDGDGLQCKQSDPPKKDKMDDVDTKVKQNLMFTHNI